MVNINIEIPDELHKRAKVAAALAEKTLKQLIIETLEAAAPKQEAKRR